MSEQGDGVSPEERRGLNSALWAIIGLPVLFLVVTAIVWAIGEAL
tara:strand:+ start:221 stop:355 length:135 start_codon:yes stop_codon:yes gene_type:complete